MKKQYLIIGGGHQGLAMAAHLSLSGEYVNLWNRSEANIAEIIKKKQIYCGGVLEGTAVLEHVSTKIGEVYEKTIFVTVPANVFTAIGSAPVADPAATGVVRTVQTANTALIAGTVLTYGTTYTDTSGTTANAWVASAQS